MLFGQIACAFGRHQIDRTAIKKTHGQEVGRCRRCRTALEQTVPGEWVVPLVRDAGLGYRGLR